MLKKTNRYIRFFIVFIFFLILLLLFGIVADEKILPSVCAVSDIKAKEIANSIIDTSVNKTINEMKIEYDDFFISDELNDTFSANTVLINNFVFMLNSNLREEIKKIEKEKVAVPFGVAFGIELFEAEGPYMYFSIKPYGDVLTDYETQIVPSGINQTSVKVWVNTEVNIRVIHPLIENKVCLKRKIMLIDTLVKGDVPGGYAGFLPGQ